MPRRPTMPNNSANFPNEVTSTTPLGATMVMVMMVPVMGDWGSGECGTCCRNQQKGGDKILLHSKNVPRDRLCGFLRKVTASRQETGNGMALPDRRCA